MTHLSTPGKERSTSARVRASIARGGDRIWRVDDFPGSTSAVATALSRMAKSGEIERVAKGAYYRPRKTVIGRSRPSTLRVREAATRALLQPAGLTAANTLGLTTQNPAVIDLATTSSWAPGAYRSGAHVVTRRPKVRAGLAPREAAVLEVLRDRAATSDLSPRQTCERLTDIVRDPKTFARLARVAAAEPPRVRAMLGALAEQAGHDERRLRPIRASLNPLSRFDFGVLRELPTARAWRAKP